MIELGIVAVLSVAFGVAWALVVKALPPADVARAASRELGSRVAERSAVRRFVRSRLDPFVVGGLTLTLVLVTLLVVCVAFGVAIAMIRAGTGVVRLDVAVSSWAAAHSTETSRAVLGALTWAGSTAGVVLAAALATLYAFRRRWDGSIVLFFIVVVAGQSLLSNLIKIAVDRVRPDEPPFSVFSGPSFPSGHATAAAATWAAVALVIGRDASPRLREFFAGGAVTIAVAVACSRVFLGAHWISDVIGGLLLGWTWFGLCAVAFGGRVLRLGAPVKEAARSRSRLTKA